jgi:hypothetical protein
VFCIYLRTICNFYLTRHQMICFLNWGGECLLRGTPCVFMLDRMRFVFKELNILKDRRHRHVCLYGFQDESNRIPKSSVTLCRVGGWTVLDVSGDNTVHIFRGKQSTVLVLSDAEWGGGGGYDPSKGSDNLSINTTSHRRKIQSSATMLWERQISKESNLYVIH